MSAPALARPDGPRLQVRGTSYPVLLPSIRDPRLHLASVIISLQILGQVAFGFDLSIAQILVALGTAGILEFTITFARNRVIMWPASALLTGNGVAFILRVNGTEHGDWWSLHGWWVFAGTAAIALLSKYVIRLRGRHIFNPSNFGLVVCFLAIGPEIAEPLDFWWGPMDPWMVLALAIIVGGGLAILRRLRLLEIAVLFWVTFAVALAILTATRSHDDRALAPRADRRLALLAHRRVLARDPDLPLLHDHRPEDDPGREARTPRLRDLGRASRRASDRSVHDRVPQQGRRSRRADDRLRRLARAPDRRAEWAKRWAGETPAASCLCREEHAGRFARRGLRAGRRRSPSGSGSAVRPRDFTRARRTRPRSATPRPSPRSRSASRPVSRPSSTGSPRSTSPRT